MFFTSGDYSVTECLLGRGMDVFAKNNRGHVPYVLCTDLRTRKLLQGAMDAKACKTTGMVV